MLATGWFTDTKFIIRNASVVFWLQFPFSSYVGHVVCDFCLSLVVYVVGLVVCGYQYNYYNVVVYMRYIIFIWYYFSIGGGKSNKRNAGRFPEIISTNINHSSENQKTLVTIINKRVQY